MVLGKKMTKTHLPCAWGMTDISALVNIELVSNVTVLRAYSINRKSTTKIH